jgi:hypothetical protein
MAILLVMKNIFRNIFEGSKPPKDPHRPSLGGFGDSSHRSERNSMPKTANSKRKVRQSEHYFYIVIIILDFLVTLCTNGEGRKAATFTSER